MSPAVAGAARLLPPDAVAEDWAAHLRGNGPPPLAAAAALIGEVEAAGLTGRGGAGFPAATKWRAVAERSRRDAVVVANASETEPASAKDRTLLSLRPHLVIDGLQLAGAAVGAAHLYIYMSRSDRETAAVVGRALDERRRATSEPPVELVFGPSRYVAGEETAVVNHLSGGQAKPRVVPPRPFEQGVRRRPTLVANVETLAHAALIARHGAGWFRASGSNEAPGTALLTVTGAVRAPGVVEVSLGSSVAQVVAAAGGATAPPQALLVGGYFGRWATAESIWNSSLEPSSLGRLGLSLGAGVIAVLPEGVCGVVETDRVLHFLARESAGQCGPCSVGLPSLAQLFHTVVIGRADQSALHRLSRWALDIRGRGACRHPDGATLFAASAMEVFAAELARHRRRGLCPEAGRPPLLPAPLQQDGWR